MIPNLQRLRSKTKVQLAKFGKGVNNGSPEFDVDIEQFINERNLDSREFPVLNVRPERQKNNHQVGFGYSFTIYSGPTSLDLKGDVPYDPEFPIYGYTDYGFDEFFGFYPKGDFMEVKEAELKGLPLHPIVVPISVSGGTSISSGNNFGNRVVRLFAPDVDPPIVLCFEATCSTNNKTKETYEGRIPSSLLFTAKKERLYKIADKHLYEFDEVSNNPENDSWESISTALSRIITPGDFDAAIFMDKLIMVNGKDRLVATIPEDPEESLEIENKLAYLTTATTPDPDDFPQFPESHFLTVHRNRLFAANKFKNEVYFSALRDIEDWTSIDDAGSITIESQGGENISALATYNNHVLLFKNNALYELYGSGPEDFLFQTVSNSIGCISHKTVKEVDGLLFFLGERGVFMYRGGMLPRLISDPAVDGFMERMDLSRKEDACAGVYRKRYFLSLPIDEDDNVLLVYDADNRSWHVEDNINITHFTNYKDILIGMEEDLTVFSLVPAEFFITDETEIDWYGITKKIEFEGFSASQDVRSMQIVVDLPKGSRFKCAMRTDNGEFKDIFTFQSSSILQNKRIQVPLNIGKSATWYQLKFYGVGECTMHRVEILSRMRDSSYLRG